MTESSTRAADKPVVEDSSSRRPIFQVETTGSYWGDRWEAFKRLSLVEDAQRIGEIPCARSSLLSGIASGVGIGVIRAISTRPLVACNWAVGTFTLVSLGTWEICQRNLRQERARVQQVMETFPKRFVKPAEAASQDSSQPTSA